MFSFLGSFPVLLHLSQHSDGLGNQNGTKHSRSIQGSLAFLFKDHGTRTSQTLQLFRWSLTIYTVMPTLKRKLICRTILSRLNWVSKHSIINLQLLVRKIPSNPDIIVEHPGSLSAAAAKSLQSCPTLCDPIDGSPPGSPILGILLLYCNFCWIPRMCFRNMWILTSG